ncbi:MAG: hypothetical protein PF505_12535 [Vallitaleaceae bacterium]|jgi:hypothetical protein|nr:hypothetical protein [Vallitaleaceae bacterium]
MNRRKYPYTAISFVLIGMVVFVLFMMSDILFAKRNNLTLLKGAITTEFNGNGLYDGVSKYNFIATQSENGENLFLEYMTILGFELVSEYEDDSDVFMYQDRKGNDLLVRKESFMGRYIIWDFSQE